MLMTGRFGRFGGAYVPEILVPAITELEDAFLAARGDQVELADLAAPIARYDRVAVLRVPGTRESFAARAERDATVTHLAPPKS